MNKFIEITNHIIAQKLKDKIKLSSIEYSIYDGILTVRVKYYTDTFEKKGFSYSFYENKFDEMMLETDFNCFIDKNF